MSLTLAYPVASAYDWKPLTSKPGVKNIFRSLSAFSNFGNLLIKKNNHLVIAPSSHQTLTAAGDLLALVSLSIGLLTLFAGLSLL
jgi:hypothetical protein